MSVFGLLKRIIKPVTDIIDKAVTDKDMAKQLKHDIEMTLSESLDKELEARRDIIVAEAQGESWLQRSWRPITMLSFLVLLFIYWLGLAPEYVVQSEQAMNQVFQLLQIGIGGYIVGRSGEKIMQNYKNGKQS